MICVFHFLLFLFFFSPTDIETRNNNFQYEVIGSLPNLNQFNFKLRDKREVSVENNNKASTVPVSVPSTSTVTDAPSIKSNDGNQTQPITLENNKKPLLGVNGTGQLLNITSTSATPIKPAIVSEPINSDDTKPTKDSTSIKSIATPNTTIQASTTLAPDFEDRLIDGIDESEEAINKTIAAQNVVRKEDYYQYYNTTILIDKEKSIKYWSDLKNFTTSSLLSKSHRRAIVRVHFRKSFQIGWMAEYFNYYFRRCTYHLTFHFMDIRCEM